MKHDILAIIKEGKREMALVLFLGGILSCGTPSSTVDNKLVGVWKLSHTTDNSPMAIPDGFEIEPPRTASPSKVKRDTSFRETWGFDGKYAYVLKIPSILQVAKYSYAEERLNLNFGDEYELTYTTINQNLQQLQVSIENSALGGYTDTLTFKKLSDHIGAFQKYQDSILLKRIRLPYYFLKE